MNENEKKENVWNTLTIGKKIGWLVYLIANSLTLGLPNIVVSLILLPMALMSIYKHYEGFDRVTEGLKYVGGIALGMLVHSITFGADSWYRMFGDFTNVYEYCKECKAVGFAAADEVDWED